MLHAQMGYLSLAVIVAAVTVMGSAILVLNRLIGPRRSSPVKQATFECGSDPIGSAHQRFSVKFYLVAIFFIVFDIESVFMYPWAGLFRELLVEPGFGVVTVVEMFVFVGILAAGLAYVWRRGALDWE
ncbi:MAG: NADH-quinone oxidoreductase subunit A [Deltaproteobacteria bacterium]|nr:NADH-quinone oxidoreductase subunit A [Deltaproteobacteria bacterium]